MVNEASNGKGGGAQHQQLQQSQQLDPTMCLELALEGERLCKSGDFTAGVAFLEAAVRLGTDDARVLSAIYSQLGNAYFYLSDYERALRFHELDLKIVQTQRDALGEAKASGNLGNTLKMLGRFDEATLFCERHLIISRKEGDKIGEGRAYYNLGNVFHSKAKQLARGTRLEPGDYPVEVRVLLHKAVECYEKNLDLMVKLSDRVAQGRAYGNLGNTHYLLGNFRRAITFHEQRLKFATEFRDRAAERRAYSNLGNCHVFLGEFARAAECYRRTRKLAQQLNDRAVEAQACYSLGNIYTLIGDLENALGFHLEHLEIAKELQDRVGEGRAYQSLAHCHQGLGSLEKAAELASLHLQLAQETGDTESEVVARQTLEELSAQLGTPIRQPPHKVRRRSMEDMSLVSMTPESRQATGSATDNENEKDGSTSTNAEDDKAEAMETSCQAIDGEKNSFLDMLTELQGDRMDDQRCQVVTQASSSSASVKRFNLRTRSVSVDTHHRDVLHHVSSTRTTNSTVTASQTTAGGSGGQRVTGSRTRGSISGVSGATGEVREELLDLIEGLQSRRMNEQRTSLPQLPGLIGSGGAAEVSNSGRGTGLGRRAVGDNGHLQSNINNNNSQVVPNRMQLSGEDFFEMLARCQSSRLEEQRSRMPQQADTLSLGSADSGAHLAPSNAGQQQNAGNAAGTSSGTTHRTSAPTVPDEDFFSLILKVQGDRIEDQRTAFKPIQENLEAHGASDSGRASSGKGSGSGSGGTGSQRSSTRSNRENAGGLRGSLKQALKAVARNARPSVKLNSSARKPLHSFHHQLQQQQSMGSSKRKGLASLSNSQSSLSSRTSRSSRLTCQSSSMTTMTTSTSASSATSGVSLRSSSNAAASSSGANLVPPAKN
ncbi:G-protein-signaling modulator 1-like isoform X2 [Varroa jacobsoni]|nr:G-protein-signaling modulator 1-like isoform X2 [Varroa destructor]XP_022703319.1 G-protein-signaling modulator 1-like isoform X2 [Varroa jacobsoni]